jgi:hypothetical protein
MGKSLEEKLKKLPATRLKKIQKKANQLIAEEMSLRDLRRALALTQDTLADTLDIGQDGVSRLEKRSDLLLSTLSRYVSAMGGELKFVVEFKDRPPVMLTGLTDMLPEVNNSRRPDIN